ncbi:uncharacterized protein LOC106179780 [Lingula anatina]|uniref:Uncharacterized protein LOC106179780 n=1 Tax=Lingula anatina TaxID=7574 RepID=A0A1S3K916_LINAN|nr:uncharacterized protein LOC106179780 [Lingula anatina]XP_013418992.2 uncharacterized protein LOC106179780 [Lingula anatina]XP_023931411.1 uncharacterized protein LOC106179780 [Lingula anatina]XP_023931412.1 uncharacterized protein LOC106179780 [Lingula anatina]|eukprot:XP_013418991.2 uncharacterized protein LOC106179780 [Lingula anatina]
MAEVEEIPYRCPKCGDLKTFSTFSELRSHMHLDHSFEDSNRKKPGIHFSIDPEPKHGTPFREMFSKEAKKLEEQLKRAKEIERQNKIAASKFKPAKIASLDIRPVREVESFELQDVAPKVEVPFTRQAPFTGSSSIFPPTSDYYQTSDGRPVSLSYLGDTYSPSKSRSHPSFLPPNKIYGSVNSPQDQDGQTRGPVDTITYNSLQRELEIKELKLLQAKAESQNLSDSLDLSQIYTDKLRKEQELLVKQLKEKLKFKDAKLEIANEELEKLSKERQKLQQETLEWSRENDAMTQSVEALHEQLEDKDKEIERKEAEIKKLKNYLEKAAEQESGARQKLEEMIDTIIDRAESAEEELRTIKGSPVYRSASMMEMRRPDQPLSSPVRRSTSALQSRPDHHVSFQPDRTAFNRYPSAISNLPNPELLHHQQNGLMGPKHKKAYKKDHRAPPTHSGPTIHLSQLNNSSPVINHSAEYMCRDHVPLIPVSDKYPVAPPTHGSTDSGIGEGPNHGVYGSTESGQREAPDEDMLMDRDGIMWNGLYPTSTPDGVAHMLPPGGHQMYQHPNLQHNYESHVPPELSQSFGSQYASSSGGEPESEPEFSSHQSRRSPNQTWSQNNSPADTFFIDDCDALFRSLKTQELQMKQHMKLIKQQGKQLRQIRDQLNNSKSPSHLNRSFESVPSYINGEDYEDGGDDNDDVQVTVSEVDSELENDSDLDQYIDDIEAFLPLDSPERNTQERKQNDSADVGRPHSGHRKVNGQGQLNQMSGASRKHEDLNNTPVQNSTLEVSRLDSTRRRRDALFCVFLYLDTKSLSQVSAVSREWRQVGRHPALWKNLKFQNSRISSRFLQTISKWCKQIHSLTFEGLRSRARKKTEHKKDYLDSVRGALEAGLEHLLKASGSTIISLRISGCGNILTDRSLWLISCHCKKLEKLAYLSSSSPASSEVIWALGAGCKRINTLLMPPVYPSSLPHTFNNSSVKMIGKCWPHLRVLCIGGIDVNVEGLTAIAGCCLRLQVLELDHMCQVMENTALAMCKAGLKGLQILEFTFTPVTPKALVHFNSACHHLKKISVHVGISDYYDDPKNKNSMDEYRQIIGKLKELKRRPGFEGVLHIKSDYG